MKNLLITKMPIKNSEVIVAAKCEDFKLRQIDLNCDKDCHIGDIYVGKVKNIVKNIQSAFIDIGNHTECYISLSDLIAPVFLNKISKNKPLVVGDELLVQIIKEASKGKAAVVTSNLSFTGKYFVITTGKKNIGISKKITGVKSEYLKEFILKQISEYDDFEFGVIARTNAKEATDAKLENEFNVLINKAGNIIKNGMYRTCFSKIYEALPEHLIAIKDCYMDKLDKIITDDETLYDEIKSYLTEYQLEDLEKLQLYTEKMLPLYKLYNLQNQIDDATKKHVWLKSGGYLIIEQTEAMVVVDVNTGKFDSKRKDKQMNFYKINVEAAKELANQIILRNLSGMILVDFISMDNQKYIDDLVNILVQEIKKDPVKTDFIDITKLGIVELTRKKQKKSLVEILNSI